MTGPINPEKLVTAEEAIASGKYYVQVEASYDPNSVDENDEAEVNYSKPRDTPKGNVVFDILFQEVNIEE